MFFLGGGLNGIQIPCSFLEAARRISCVVEEKQPFSPDWVQRNIKNKNVDYA